MRRSSTLGRRVVAVEGVAPWRATVRPLGFMLVGLALGMVVSGLVGLWMAWADPHPLDGGSFLPMGLSALVTGGAGGVFITATRHDTPRPMSRREGVLAVSLIWLLTSLFGSVPFIFGAGLHPIDALFETVSGFTTTGASILPDIEGSLSRSLLFWRSLIQWLGGMGIVVLFVAIFPSLGVGAKHMYRSEVPGTSAEGLQPRIAETGIALWALYAVFTVANALVLWALGMTPFEATCHAFTTMSTGGFSTRNDSIGAFHSPAMEVAIGLFMVAAGANFALYYGVVARRNLRLIWQSLEFRVYLGLVVFSTLALALSILPVHPSPLQALRFAFFGVATTITSTGFGADAYMKYPPGGLLILVLLMFIGASSGSTAGGIKVERAILLAKLSLAEIRRSVRPQLVQVVRMGKAAVPDSVLLDVAAFLSVFLAVLAGATALVTFVDGVPIPTAFGASLSAISNMGPAPWFLKADNYADYTYFSKVVFSVTMVLGRLEFYTLLALLTPDLWRRS